VSLFNHAAEKALLAAILIDPALLPQAESLVALDDFHEPHHRRIYTAMLVAQGRGKSIDVPTLVGINDGIDPTYAASLLDGFPRVSNVEQWAKEIRGKATLRTLRSVGAQIAELALEQGDAEEAVAGATSLLLGVANSARLGNAFRSSDDLASKASDAIYARMTADAGIVGLRTGIRSFDEITGGMRPGQLIIIGGRPATGKTAAAMTIADNLAQAGCRIAFFSLEMTDIDITVRRLHKRSRADAFGLRIGKHQFDRVLQAAGTMHGDQLYIDHTPDQTLDLVRAKTRRFALEFGLDLVLIDYLQLIRCPAESRQQEVAAVARGLKNMAKELEVPVVALSQLNRESANTKDKRPTMAQLKESGEQEQAADIVVLIHRPWAYDHDANPEEAEWIIAKQRDGQTGDVPVRYIHDLTTFEDAKVTAEVSYL